MSVFDDIPDTDLLELEDIDVRDAQNESYLGTVFRFEKVPCDNRIATEIILAIE